MTMMSDLSLDLVLEILSKVPITSLRTVRSTCKRWDDISKDQSFKKKHCGKLAKDFLGIMLYDFKVFLMSINLHGISNHEDLVDQSIKKIGQLLSQVEIDTAIHCEGILLFEQLNSFDELVAWNPYLEQVRWIQRNSGYNKYDKYFLGYDNINKTPKILSVLNRYCDVLTCEIYDFKSDSWRVLEITPGWGIYQYQQVVCVKGNIYFVALVEHNDFLRCFDFTRESFGPCLPLPPQACFHTVILSSLREKQLAALVKRKDTYEMEIWITTMIEPSEVSFSKLFVVDDERFSSRLRNFDYCSLFFNEEKKIVVVCVHDYKEMSYYDNIACVIREDGYYKEVDLGKYSECQAIICSYVPSLVHIE